MAGSNPSANIRASKTVDANGLLLNTKYQQL